MYDRMGFVKSEAGRFFGAARPAEAARLATFLHAPGTPAENLRSWFGDDAPALVAAGRDALRAALDGDIAAIDALLGEQLDAVLHAERLQVLEGRWRGMAWLLSGLEPGRRVVMRYAIDRTADLKVD